MLDRVALEIGPEAVVVVSREPLTVASTAVVNGGLAPSRAIINLHVPKDHPCADPPGMIARYARARGLPEPWVGLLTSAWTAKAEVGFAGAGSTRAMAVVTVGLSNRLAAGMGALRGPPDSAGTVNMIVVVDGDPGPAALLNAMLAATEAKALALFEAGVVCDGGSRATGTSTDAVVIAATGQGAAHEFGGPATELGWCVARAAREALVPVIARWKAEHA
jgi:adenosylcobinamide amidohydrolase